MRLAREQQIVPEVNVSFETRRKGLFCLVLKNFGGSPAKNLRLELSEDWIQSLPRNQKTFRNLKTANLVIVPNQECIFILGGEMDYDSLTKVKMEGKLVYFDIFGIKHEQDILIDLKSFEGILINGPEMDELTTTIKEELEDIAEEVRKLSEKLEKIHNR